MILFQDQALESSKNSREKEWSNFMTDVQDKCSKIDDAYKQKEKAMRAHYANLEKELDD